MANGKSYVYRNPRPQLSIELAGGANLGRCYSATYYRVTSTRPLDAKTIRSLRDAGFLGYGQEFMFHQRLPDGNKARVPDELDWRTTKDVAPSGTEMIPCVEVDDRTGEPTGNPPVNPYSGKLYEPMEQSYFIYDCESRVDSSD